MKNIRNYGIETQCVHAGLKETKEGAVVTPIYQTSTFKFQDADHGARLFKGEEEGYIYTRMRNPTVEAMEDAVAILEGGAKALGCATGMAAVHTLFAATLKAGDHIICSESCYGATATLLANLMPNFGISTTFVDTSNLDEVKNAIQPNTKMIYAETPGNPTLIISDLQELSNIARSI
ncbi:MAG TPA: PLP-dependent transferase, partial [Candidatus Kapabacteria bacterium]|nr:PLP-dependent transferase [Candidatus Kapabacteria bacterium]